MDGRIDLADETIILKDDKIQANMRRNQNEQYMAQRTVLEKRLWYLQWYKGSSTPPRKLFIIHAPEKHNKGTFFIPHTSVESP